MTEPAYARGHKIQYSAGKVVKTREYQYTTYSGDSIVIQEHSYLHIGSEEAYFNVRPKEDTRNGTEKYLEQRNIIHLRNNFIKYMVVERRS